MRSAMFLLGIFFIMVFSGCFSSTSNFKKKTVIQNTRSVEPAETERPRKKAPIVRYTFLDTLNEGNELLLTDSDFETSAPADKSLLSSGALPESLYRIQVFASNKIETVREQKKELEKNTDESILIDYESPYYKLYAGGFVKRQEAQIALTKLKKIGYLDAWIVSKKINQ